jgi:hypothetical protein
VEDAVITGFARGLDQAVAGIGTQRVMGDAVTSNADLLDFIRAATLGLAE